MRSTPEEEAGDDPASSLLEGTLERQFHPQTKSFDSSPPGGQQSLGDIYPGLAHPHDPIP